MGIVAQGYFTLMDYILHAQQRQSGKGKGSYRIAHLVNVWRVAWRWHWRWENLYLYPTPPPPNTPSPQHPANTLLGEYLLVPVLMVIKWSFKG